MKELVESIEKSKILDKSDVELLILNNGSTDGTNVYLSQLKENLKFKLLTKSINIIGSRAYLTLVEEASGEWIIFPGDDDIFYTDQLIELPNLIQNMGKEFNLISFGAQAINEVGQTDYKQYYPPTEKSKEKLLAELFCENIFCMPSTIIRRSVTLDRRIPLSITAFDWSLWILAISTGEVFRNHKLLIKYRRHSGQEQKSYIENFWNIDKIETFRQLITNSKFQEWVVSRGRNKIREFLEHLVATNAKKRQTFSNQLLFIWLGQQIFTKYEELQEYVIELLIILGLDPRFLEVVFSREKDSSRYRLAVMVLSKKLGSIPRQYDNLHSLKDDEIFKKLLVLQRKQENDEAVTEFETRVLKTFRKVKSIRLVKCVRSSHLARFVQNIWHRKQL